MGEPVSDRIPRVSTLLHSARVNLAAAEEDRDHALGDFQLAARNYLEDAGWVLVEACPASLGPLFMMSATGTVYSLEEALKAERAYRQAQEGDS